ncbi:uncharacterized protein LOC126837502 [Adelges cooleyi]|uniref:uncharacterized protein LOC126837502 n=1 Tax=Adelges cooleyi TaxID=133065 RepID=UPI00217FBF11|nr:uncharacterized protein LOC126837502 [Adelges cooleyi]
MAKQQRRSLAALIGLVVLQAILFACTEEVAAGTVRPSTLFYDDDTNIQLVSVDVPPLVRATDDTYEANTIYLVCTYTMYGENGDGSNQQNDSARMKINDLDMEKLQQQKGVVIKWFFRRTVSDEEENNYTVQRQGLREELVYQWIAGAGVKDGNGNTINTLRNRAVDVSSKPLPVFIPKGDNLLHRVLKISKPTPSLTGEYKCRVESWKDDVNSNWYPMIVHTTEKVFNIDVNEVPKNDAEDHDDVNHSANETTSTTLQPRLFTSTRKPRTYMNVTCFASGVQPRPAMEIWVNNMLAMATGTQITVDAPNKTALVPYQTYSVLAYGEVSVDPYVDPTAPPANHQHLINQLFIECRLRVPGLLKSSWSDRNYYVSRRGKGVTPSTVMAPVDPDYQPFPSLVTSYGNEAHVVAEVNDSSATTTTTSTAFPIMMAAAAVGFRH